MKKGIDCEVFQDQLDALAHETLPDEGLSPLRAHAAACADCAMLLRVHEHLAEPARAALEAAVPEDMVASVWPRVRLELRGRAMVRRGWNWLVPALAAATVLLALGVGFLFAQLRQLESRERLLTQQVLDRQGPETSNAAVRTAALAGRPTWERALARRERVSVAQLGAMLRRVPESSTVLTPSQTQALLSGAPPWTRTIWSEVLSRIDVNDGVQAGELRDLLRELPVDPQRSMPTARILGLLRSGAAGSL